MSEILNTLSLFNLAYPSEDSVLYATPPHSLIYYKLVTLLDQADQHKGEGGLDGYDGSYIIGEEASTCYEMPSIFPIKKATRLTFKQTIPGDSAVTANTALKNDSIYLETP